MRVDWLLVAHKGQQQRKHRVPSSKSHTIRAVAIASLAAGQSTIRSPLVSSDTQAAVDCYRALGAGIDTTDPACWKVAGTAGQIKAPQKPIDVGNSGTTLRIATGSAATAPEGQTTIFTGDKQIKSRPIGPLLNSLEELGTKCKSIKNNGKAPVKVTGKIKGGKTTIAASTSQYLTSLLLCTPLAAGDTEIDVTLLNEPGYVQMTLDWLDKQGIEYKNENMQLFKIKGRQSYKSFDTTIPADFSSATFFFCAGALLADKPIMIKGLDFTDSQPDKAVVDYLKAMGADITIEPGAVRIKAAPLKGVEIDMNKTPDALPAMAVTAAFAKGTTKLLNVPQARAKETDRIKCMAEELKKIAIDVEELPDGLIIHGGKAKPPDPSSPLDGQGDHRIIMALTIAALKMKPGQCKIKNCQAVNVTFPEFSEFIRSLGRKIEPIGGIRYKISCLQKNLKIRLIEL